MSNYWGTIAPSIIELFRSLPSEDMTTQYQEGVVCWFNRQVPFISPETRAGIYLRWTKIRLTSKTGNTWRPVTRVVDGLPVTNLQLDQRVSGKATLQVQVKSLESTDVSWSIWYLSNIQSNIWTEAAHQYLRGLGLSVINTGALSAHDAPIDDREASIGTLDINLNFAYTVNGALDTGTIETVAGGLTAHDSAVTGGPITGPITAP